MENCPIGQKEHPVDPLAIWDKDPLPQAVHDVCPDVDVYRPAEQAGQLVFKPTTCEADPAVQFAHAVAPPAVSSNVPALQF